MRYLAILGYDCGCSNEANYTGVETVRFHAENRRALEKRVEKLKTRKARETHQCVWNCPIEILVLNPDFNLVTKLKRDKGRDIWEKK